METAALILEYVRTLAWPIVVLVAVLVFKSQIEGALTRLTGGEVDALGVKFRVELEKARREVEQVEAEAQSPPSSPSVDEPDLAVQESVDAVISGTLLSHPPRRGRWREGLVEYLHFLRGLHPRRDTGLRASRYRPA